MQIEMTADFKVAADGFTVELWAAGSAHEVTEQLGNDLIEAGKARLARKVSAPDSSKAETPKPKMGYK